MFKEAEVSFHVLIKLFFFSGLMCFIALGTSCASSSNRSSGQQAGTSVPDEKIMISINEAVQFEFEKYDSTWTGDLTLYTLNGDNERVVKAAYTSAQDSSWNDFDLFVETLDIYTIPPQHEIEDWVPNSGELPRLVYNFEVFNGDTTRSYSYQDPENGIRDFWQAQNVLIFTTFVQNDLRWEQTK